MNAVWTSKDNENAKRSQHMPAIHNLVLEICRHGSVWENMTDKANNNYKLLASKLKVAY